ncbi:hypothetical protein LFM09_06575 [Lentzea alba]|uniref:hypothetical protein n=1 Tax=Lentzea alba TaxID=2714351 RepID=UPI0039BFEA0D
MKKASVQRPVSAELITEDEQPHRSSVAHVVAPSHSSVSVAGLGGFFRAERIDVRNSGGVVVGHDCELKTEDHYHAYRASLDMEPLLDPSAEVRKAIQALAEDPHNDTAISQLQRALAQFASDKPVKPRTQVLHPAAENAEVTADDIDVVQVADRTLLRHNTKYVVEERVVPLVDLLVKDRRLVTALGVMLSQPTVDNVDSFARLAVRVSGQFGDLEQLAQLPLELAPRTTLFHFWGDKLIDQSSAVMLGTGHRITQRMRLDLPELSKRSLVGDVERLLAVHGLEPKEPVCGQDERVPRESTEVTARSSRRRDDEQAAPRMRPPRRAHPPAPPDPPAGPPVPLDHAPKSWPPLDPNRPPVPLERGPQTWPPLDPNRPPVPLLPPSERARQNPHRQEGER